jgi:ParB family chromosome partitioning protein
VLTADPNQPRKFFDPELLERLAASLKERGQPQPVRVRWDETMQRWILIAGERRLRAAALAGMPRLAAVEASPDQTLSEDEIREEQLVENCVREDLRPIEQAHAYEALMKARGLSQRQLAEGLHIGQATIAKALALSGLAPAIQEAVDAGTIAPATA